MKNNSEILIDLKIIIGFEMSSTQRGYALIRAFEITVLALYTGFLFPGVSIAF
jgi:hypothetical protein